MSRRINKLCRSSTDYLQALLLVPLRVAAHAFFYAKKGRKKAPAFRWTIPLDR
ncbi:MAG: hypothetical protein AB7F19_06945 [Candidatus Babeliales bacterium]